MLGAFTLLLLLAGTLPAQAHDALISSSPAADAVVPTAPGTVELEFTGTPLPLGTEVLVLGPDGGPVSTGAPVLRDATVVQALTGPLPAGPYTVEWRSTSSDGHPLTGSFSFSVLAPAAGSAAAAPAAGTGTRSVDRPTAGIGAAAAAGDRVVPGGWLVAGVLALAVLGLLLVARLRRRV